MFVGYALFAAFVLEHIAAYGRRPDRQSVRLERLRKIDEWITSNHREAPPAHWRVRGPEDIAAESTVLVESKQKEVNASTLARAGDGESVAPRVIIKALRREAAFAFGNRESDIAYFELLYLEYLRDEPGIPHLYGGWTSPSHVVWVVSDGGTQIGSGRKDPKMAPEYDARAREAPLELARSWFRLFRSFAEQPGGFVLTDFKAEQFTIDGRGELSLVDGPAPNSGPLGDFAHRHFASGATPHRSLDLRPGLSVPCGGGEVPKFPSADPIMGRKHTHQRNVSRTYFAALRANMTCAKRTYYYHHCFPLVKCNPPNASLAETRGAPELHTCRDGRCDAFDGGVHVWDVADKQWILPRIIELAEDRGAAARLEALRPRMMREDPRDRPTFASLLADLAS